MELFWFLACALFAVLSLYVYFVHTAALTAVRFSERMEEGRRRGAALSELEKSYLSQKRAITLSLAYREGFEDARGVTFVVRKALGALVRSNEI